MRKSRARVRYYWVVDVYNTRVCRAHGIRSVMMHIKETNRNPNVFWTRKAAVADLERRLRVELCTLGERQTKILNALDRYHPLPDR